MVCESQPLEGIWLGYLEKGTKLGLIDRVLAVEAAGAFADPAVLA